ncbi:pseudouridine synthase [Biscogniauxia marginata]|nr:pseudouridine synthase [Biscogniauxia marginata]
MRLLSNSCHSGRLPRSLNNLTDTAAYRQVGQCRFHAAARFSKSKISPRPYNMDGIPDYKRWTKDSLIARIQALETEARARDHQDTDQTSLKPQKKKPERRIDPSKYSTRIIALKLAYLGKNYGGFEFQASSTLTTIEEELWKAFVKACLIFPENPKEVRFDDWEYSKCGRTDRGVSAFGQVISIRVRSNRPLPKKPVEVPAAEDDATADNELPKGAQEDSTAVESADKREFDDFVDELPYAKILNRLLPPDIQILAWCPTTPAEFSARHDCRERQYRYFFTQPAYSPMPRSLENPARKGDRVKDGWLDIEAMRAAAKRFEGLHDFRNFCKIDASKNIVNFERRIFEADVVEVPDVATALPYLADEDFRPSPAPLDRDAGAEQNQTIIYPKVYYFHVRGSAFLWHQIRCMVAVLFMVGQGLEGPSVIDRLLDPRAEPQRPNYVLANEMPLVLWDCVFPREGDPDRKDAMEWVYQGEESPLHQHGPSGLVDQMWEQWRERKMDELLAGQLLGLVSSQADISLRRDRRAPQYAAPSQRLFEGGNRERLVGKYQPVLQRKRLPSPEEVYDREAKKKGYANAAEMREAAAKKRAQREQDEAAIVATNEGE